MTSVTIENTIEKFLSDLSEERATEDVATLWGIYTDYLEDNNHPFTEAARWMQKNNKRPYTSPPREIKEGAQPPKEEEKIDKNSWFNAATIKEDCGDPESDIPQEIWNELSGYETVANHKNYKTWKEAILDFYKAFSAAKQKGWNP